MTPSASTLGDLQKEYPFAKGELRAALIAIPLFVAMAVGGFVWSRDPTVRDRAMMELMTIVGAGFAVFFLIRLFVFGGMTLQLWTGGLVLKRRIGTKTYLWSDARAFAWQKIQLRKLGANVGVQNHVYLTFENGTKLHLTESIQDIADAAARIQAATRQYLRS